MLKTISFLTIILCTSTAMAASIMNTSTLPFPRVYTTTVHVQTGQPDGLPLFTAEVDLLTFSYIADATSEISFMVHNDQELTRLCNLATTLPSSTIGSLDIDWNSTITLHEQSSKVVERESRVTPAYKTIQGFPCYKNLQGSLTWIDDMVKRAKSIPGLTVSKKDIGKSYLRSKNATSGYNIWALKMTGTASKGATKGVFFVMTGLHPREFAPPELASRWVESLINAYGKEADITAMLNHTEIHLVLQSNPDGRQVVENNRGTYIRKNRRPSTGTCFSDSQGVDLNRNFPFGWGLDSGSSSDECSATYRGKAPASEPEVQAIVTYIQSIFPIAQRKSNPIAQQQVPYPESSSGVFLDIHSYGKLITTPWSFTSTVTAPNAQGFQSIRDKVRYFNKYTFELGYLAAGCSDDYAYGSLGAAGMNFEIGDDFFQNCDAFESDILPTNLQALTYLAKISKQPFKIAKGPDVTSISTSVYGNTLTVKAEASDSARSFEKGPTSQQSVRQIKVFVNTHPYSLSSTSGASVIKNGKVAIDVSSLQKGSRNVVYVQASDSAGYSGPVTAVYFLK